MNQAYEVKLDKFEGPLDLLLHLINQYEIDIYDIPVAVITEQYMNYIHTMQRLELNVASEYLVMAATLVAIKSEMLLPKPDIVEDTEEYMEDPRTELMERLIEYRKYKEAAEKLREREEDLNQVHTRPPSSFEELLNEPPTLTRGNISVYDMLHALGKMMERKKWKEPLETSISKAEISIEKRMDEIFEQVSRAKEGLLFYELFSVPSNSAIVVTFMALLELMKDNKVYCNQEKHFEALYVYHMEE